MHGKPIKGQIKELISDRKNSHKPKSHKSVFHELHHSGGSIGDEVDFAKCSQICFRGEDFGVSFSGLTKHKLDDPSVVAGFIEQAVKFANVDGTEAIVIIYDSLKGDGGEGEGGGGRLKCGLFGSAFWGKTNATVFPYNKTIKH